VLDERFPEWGESRYFSVELSGTLRLSELLAHLTVLIPVLDDQKHYWVGDDEIEKLLRRGEGWLETHPARDEIVSRYLVHQRGLVRDAIARLTAEEQPEEETIAAQKNEQEASIERTISLNERRLDAVVEVLKESGASRVLDLGCGEGKLLRRLLSDPQFTEIAGMDVSIRVLEQAESRLKLDRLAPKQRERMRLLHGSLMYRDVRLRGFDAAAVMEVVEHLDPLACEPSNGCSSNRRSQGWWP
jgi:3' terminal RNA ribose 2'-O-methyltransferase Hen1